MPIELLDFTAKLKNDVLELNWATVSELNNDYFTIERATDIEHFEPLQNVPGSRTTHDLHNYSTVDPAPVFGKAYYRLKQTDFDGGFSYSHVVAVDYDGPRFSTLKPIQILRMGLASALKFWD